MKTHILTVSQLTAQIKDLLEGTFPEVWVEGEISNLSIPQSGRTFPFIPTLHPVHVTAWYAGDLPRQDGRLRAAR